MSDYQIKHDDDGFLLSKFFFNPKDRKNVNEILDNTDELLISNQATKRLTVRHTADKKYLDALNNFANAMNKNTLYTKGGKRKTKGNSLAVQNLESISAENNNPVLTQFQRREEKQRVIQSKEQKVQTRLLEEIAKSNKQQSNKKSGLLGGLFGGLTGLPKLLKTLNPIKTAGLGVSLLGGAASRLLFGNNNPKTNITPKTQSARGADGRFLPKGATPNVSQSSGGFLNKFGKSLKMLGKGGALAAVFSLFDGINVENNQNLTRAEKNKQHAKNFTVAGGGVGGAMAGASVGAAIGSVVPVVGTAIGGVLGGLLGGVAGSGIADYAVNRLDKSIDPKLSNQMFGSWNGAMQTLNQGFAGVYNALPESWNSLFTNIQNAAQGVFSTIGVDFKGVTATISNTFEKITNSIAQSDFGKSVSDGLATAWNGVKEFVSEKVETAKSNIESVGNNLKNSALSYIGYDMTKKYDKLEYGMGKKGLNGGSIDCSGWSFQVTKMEMESLNQMLGFEKYKIKGNQAGILNVGNHGAAEQIGLLAEQHGVVTDSRTKFDINKLKAGMIIGQMKHSANYKGRTTNVKGYGKTQYNHVVKVVRNKDGELYISESQGGSKNGGVTLTKADEWVNARLKRGDTLTAVNPFGDDIGLLNGEITSIVKNEVSKVGRNIEKLGNGVLSAVGLQGSKQFTGNSKNKIFKQMFHNKDTAQKADNFMMNFNAQGSKVHGLTEEQTFALATLTAATESSFNYNAVNNSGYIGAYQFGAMALEDLGLVKKGTGKKGNSALKDPSNWNIKGGLNEFLTNKSMQDKAFVDYVNINYKYLKNKGISDEQLGLGKNVDIGQVMYWSKASHLVGHNGAGKLLKHGIDKKDGNGQSAREYGNQAAEAHRELNPMFQAVWGIKQGKQPYATATSTVSQQAVIKEKNISTNANTPVIANPKAVKTATPTTVIPQSVPTISPVTVPMAIQSTPTPVKTVMPTATADVQGGNRTKIAHQPTNRTVSHGFIAHQASGGIMKTVR